MFGRTASLLSRSLPPPTPDSAGSASASASATPARAALLQAPRAILKRDGENAGFPERAGRSNRPAPAEADATLPRFADDVPGVMLKF